ncbi:MAG: RDD family protein [Thermoleophilia bacterium]|nr:RDD family protein [Thermoleophilia bacterium]
MNDHELASWRRRAAALVVDAIVLGLVIAAALLASGMPVDELRERLEDGETLFVVLLFLVPEGIYYTALVGSRSQTFGKMALGIKVVDAESRSPIGYARAFRRWLSTAAMRALFTVPSVVDHLWPLRDPRRQALHDKFARSVVVRT